MTTTVFRSADDAPALVAAVAAALPTWLGYYNFDGEPHARPLRADTVQIRADDVPAALEALRALPDELAEAAYTVDGWRDADLVTALRNWGWATDTVGDTVRLGGIWGDVVFPASFAALLAIAPHVTGYPGLSSEPWVFGADRSEEPVFAVSFSWPERVFAFSDTVEAVELYLVD